MVLDPAAPVPDRSHVQLIEQLKAPIDAFIEPYNEDAEPFVCTKSKVHQRRIKSRRLSDL